MSLYQHFRPEEKPFVEKMMEWVRVVDTRGITKRTDFLDPRQQHILETLVNRTPGVRVRFYGGYSDAERVRALITHEDVEPSIEEFGVVVIEIENRNSFSTLTHRDYLGALMSLGMIRDKFGDLIVHDTGAQLILEIEMRDFLFTHLQQVGKSQVLLTEQSIEQIQLAPSILEEKVVTVTSMRLDAVLSEILRLSRAKVQVLIKSGKVKVNWKVEESAAAEITVGATLSVRGFGRYQILRKNGTSKKGKTVLVIGFHKES